MTTTENNTNNTNTAAQEFALRVDAERTRQMAALTEKVDTAVSGVARACVAAEDARDAARASQEAAEYVARRAAPPIAPNGFFGGLLQIANDLADKALYVAKPIAVATAIGGGAYVAGSAVYRKVTRKPAAPAPTAG